MCIIFFYPSKLLTFCLQRSHKCYESLMLLLSENVCLWGFWYR